MPSTLGDDDLELDGASATIKLDDSTFGGVTRCVDGISSLTLPLPDGSPASEYVDTGINLPAFSVLRYIFIKKTTAGVNGNGTLWVSNFAMTYNAATPSSDYDEYYGDYAAPGDYSGPENGYNLEGSATYQSEEDSGTGHWVINGLANDSVKAAVDYARDLFLKISATGDASGGTAPVVGVFVVYDLFDIS